MDTNLITMSVQLGAVNENVSTKILFQN